MLKQLHIQNLAIIDTLDLDFDQGMTVLTGETGAGKSILIDALGLILGDRGDSSIVRQGCEKSEIVAIFNIFGLENLNRGKRDHYKTDHRPRWPVPGLYQQQYGHNNVTP